MKNSLLRTFFEWALITSVLMSVGFFVWYYTKSRGVRVAESHIAAAQNGINNNHTVMAVLLAECREYAKTNADLARLLETGKPQATTAPAAPVTGAKPRTK
jgi:cytosine/uracil/thiamine/allantoin permease